MIPSIMRVAPTIPPTTPIIMEVEPLALLPPPVVEGPSVVVAVCIESVTMSCDSTTYTYSCRWICWAGVIHYFNCGIEQKN
jgi:hypothetical protein